MQVTFHGVRGSVPVSGPAFQHFGGHTTCLNLKSKDMQVIIDAGSGFQNVQIAEDRPVLLMFSHFHHDHIQGLAFNGDLLRRDRDIFVSSALYPADKVKASLQTYFDGVYFPIDLINHKHQMRFVDFDELGGLFSGLMEPHSMPLVHPGGSAAYSIAMGDARVCTLFDNEYDDAQAPALVDFVAGCDLAIWDGMFLNDELEVRRGWGHSSVEQAADFFSQSTAGTLAITHHGPMRTDEQLSAISSGIGDERISFAYQNQQIEL